MAELVADVVVVGLGPGGEEVAERLVDAGLDVVGVEAALFGGECPYWGCIPSKMMIRAGNALAEARRVDLLAGHATVTPDWAPVARRIRDQATDDWDDKVAVERFTARGGRFVRGRGRLLAADRVAVGDDVITARRAVVIGTGTTPVIPAIPGLVEAQPWTNHQAIEVEHVPDSLLVLGGGAIGVELAQVFARFGVTVTVVEVGRRLLSREEPEACDVLHEVFAAEGIAVHTGLSLDRVDRVDGRIRARLGDGTVVEAAEMLVATGRKVDLAAVGVGVLGVDEGARSLPTDGRLRVAPGVWAVGDITGRGAFTHVAVHQAGIIVDDILGREPADFDEHAIPRVTFTDPEVGSVGLSEEQARAAGLAVRTGQVALSRVSRGWIHGPGNEGLIKLVADVDAGVLVGATSVGPSGGEVLGLLALAVHARVSLEQLGTMILAFPTFHRGLRDALADLRSVET